jgi:hypothetical protein
LQEKIRNEEIALQQSAARDALANQSSALARQLAGAEAARLEAERSASAAAQQVCDAQLDAQRRHAQSEDLARALLARLSAGQPGQEDWRLRASAVLSDDAAPALPQPQVWRRVRSTMVAVVVVCASAGAWSLMGSPQTVAATVTLAAPVNHLKVSVDLAGMEAATAPKIDGLEIASRR